MQPYDTTRHQSRLEPTQAAHGRNYEVTEQAYLNPYLNDQYQGVPPIPPPPPKRRSYRWLYILLLVVVAITPVTLYRIVTTAPVTASPAITKTIVVTPTPYPTFNVTNMFLFPSQISDIKGWMCAMLEPGPGQSLYTTITVLDNQSADIAAYECDRAESTVPNIGSPMSDVTSIAYHQTKCEGVTKDHTKWSVSSDYDDPNILSECRVLASW